MSIFSNINFFRDYEPPFDYKDFLWAGILGFVVGGRRRVALRWNAA